MSCTLYVCLSAYLPDLERVDRKSSVLFRRVKLLLGTHVSSEDSAGRHVIWCEEVYRLNFGFKIGEALTEEDCGSIHQGTILLVLF